MKKMLLFILLPTFIYAQTDSVKVSFSEEKVEKFEKTEIISISERMGVKRPVNAALKAGVEITPFISKNSSSGLFFSYEQKVKSVFSINFSLKILPRNTDFPFFFEVEPRWYFNMKKRVVQENQAYNITGKYISLRYKQGHFSTNESLLTSESPYLESATYSLNLGQQFGNNLDISLLAGYKNIRESFIDSKGFIRNNEQSQKSNTWFIASSFRVGVGLNYPKIKPQKYEKFEKISFSSNNFDINHLLKINLTDILYVDKYSQFLKADIAFERRISNTLFSTNSMVLASINHFKTFNQIGKIDSTIGNYKYPIPIWGNERTNNFYSYFQLTQQLRYYMKRKELRKGKSGKNFNGFYTGLEASYLNSSFTNDSNSKSFFSKQLKNGSAFGFGGVIGFQNQFNNKIIFDWGYSLLLTKGNPTGSIIFSKFGNIFINYNLKIGFVR